MKPEKKQNNITRTKLLQSACKVFAEKSYRDATVAEICKDAGANVAAVNYHFRSKKTLYVEAWRLAFHRSLEFYPPDGGVSVDAPLEQQLRGRILAILHRLADPDAFEFDIASKEMINPTGLLSEVMRKSIEPLIRGFESIIRKLLGDFASEQHIQLCRMSIMAQCFNMMIRTRYHSQPVTAANRTKLLPQKLDIEIMADHITRFSLAGIRQIKRQIENGQLNEKNNKVAKNVKTLYRKQRNAEEVMI